jgi:predicted TIM-barrel fold metal-dependent hydrolase
LLVKTFGADRLMWGSNFPAAEGTLSALLAASRRVIGCLPEQDQEAIFGGAAKRIYPALA